MILVRVVRVHRHHQISERNQRLNTNPPRGGFFVGHDLGEAGFRDHVYDRVSRKGALALQNEEHRKASRTHVFRQRQAPCL